jgi:hypothetical protein
VDLYSLGDYTIDTNIWDQWVYETVSYPGTSTYFQATQCDGSTRVSFSDLSISSLETVGIDVTVTRAPMTWISTRYEDLDIPVPTCSISPSDCQNLALAFSSGYADVVRSWDQANTVTLSLASPPVSIIVNGQTTMIPRLPYILTVHNTTYPPIYGATYLIGDADAATPYD